jgi:hypothetical protein
MKSKYFLPLALLFLLTMAQACKKDKNITITTSLTDTTLESGNWKITLFKEDINDETIYFADYAFTFNADETAVAIKSGSSQINGSWTTSQDDTKIKLVLNFTPVNSFDKISNDWEVQTVSDTKITLRDISGGNGGVDYLYFEKI